MPEKEEKAGRKPESEQTKNVLRILRMTKRSVGGNGYARINQVRMLDEHGKNQNAFATGSKVTIELIILSGKKVEDAVFGIGIFNQGGQQIYGTNTRIGSDGGI